MMILEDYIKDHARRQPEKTAIVCDGIHYTYRELQNMIEARASHLPPLTPHPSPLTSHPSPQVTCLRAYSSIDFIVSYFALHTVGRVAVPLEHNMPDETYEKVSAELCSKTVPEGSADILYTTGTTGRSKGVIISHQTILADAENLIGGQGFAPDTVFVINGPLNHIGSLSKIYPVMMLGGTVIIVDGLRDLNKFFDAFDYPSQKMATFLVPASIRILLQFSADRIARLADKIDFIETGAAAISHADMEALCRLLPKTRLYNTYASTETGIICTYDYNDGRCQAGCLGRPMQHSQVFITDKGLIACKGKTLMTGYVGDPERTASVLRDGTLYTSDIGTIDDEGMLHLAGREDDVINVGGFKVAPTEVEDAAMSYPGLKDCICIAVDHRITGKALKLLVVLDDAITLDRRALALHLKQKLEPYKIPMLYDQIEKVERTFNGKVNRKYYKVRAVS